MRTEWKKELCSFSPAYLEPVNDETLIQRKNIVEVKSDQGKMWSCESRFISRDYFEEIETQLDTYQALLDQQEAIDEANASIMLSQAEIQANQESQDETLADILLNTTQTEV